MANARCRQTASDHANETVFGADEAFAIMIVFHVKLSLLAVQILVCYLT